MAALVKSQAVLKVTAQARPALGAVCVHYRENSDIATIKRGTGGRSSFSGNVVTVLGVSGFLGKYIVNRLGKIGSQVICAHRGDPYWVRPLKLAGDLGQVLFVPYGIKDEESLRKAMKYSTAVVNLVGRDHETKNFTFKDVHVTGAGRIARIARESGVKKLIHFSSLNASDTPQSIYMKHGSQFLRTKYQGELAVRDEFPEAVIFRPADMFGAEDRFIRYYANYWRRQFGMVPLWKRGTETVKMPVFVSNVAEGVVNAILDPDNGGKTYECVGPHSYQLSELVDFFYRCMRYNNFKRSWVNPIFKMKMSYCSMMPSYPVLNEEKLEREHISDVLTGHPTLEDLGVSLLRIEDRAPFELKPFRTHRYYEERVGEFPDPAPPPVIA